MYQISYYRHWSGNYAVTLHSISQTIIVSPGHLRRVIDLKTTNVAGCCEVPVISLEDLGFILPRISFKDVFSIFK